MATHSSILALKIPWTEEPGGLQSMGSQRVGHDFTAEHTHSGRTFPSPNSASDPYQVVKPGIFPTTTSPL